VSTARHSLIARSLPNATVGSAARPVLRSMVAVTIAAAGALALSGCSSASAATSTAQPAQPPSTRAVAPDQTPSASASPTARSACTLVTSSELAPVTGKPMGPGQGTGALCSFSATLDPSTVVYVQTFNDAQGVAAPKAAEGGSEHLPCLGDDAFWSTAGVIFVQKDTRAFTISIPSLALSSAHAPTAVTALATAAAGRF